MNRNDKKKLEGILSAIDMGYAEADDTDLKDYLWMAKKLKEIVFSEEAAKPLRSDEEAREKKSAAEWALDDIADACGAPDWHYPAEVTRGVLALKAGLTEANIRNELLEAEKNGVTDLCNTWKQEAEVRINSARTYQEFCESLMKEMRAAGYGQYGMRNTLAGMIRAMIEDLAKNKEPEKTQDQTHYLGCHRRNGHHECALGLLEKAQDSATRLLKDMVFLRTILDGPRNPFVGEGGEDTRYVPTMEAKADPSVPAGEIHLKNLGEK